ncbi:MAG: cytochrome c3 family protein [Chlorobi bacterium]|nr:cytochrome c3 family protein [Chlorobiota bacterium]
MKRLIFLMTFVSFGMFVYSQTIVGSAHDFSGRNWNTTGELCIVCHTPHHSDVTVSDAPLWNHEVSTATYTLYSSPTLDATMEQPGNSSKLCLSCHDGTVAIENFGGVTDGTRYLTGNSQIGPDLSGHHPVSFVYDAALSSADKGLFDPTSTSSGLGSTISDDMLINNKLECASCHDVHNGYGVDYLLVKDNQSSALCLTCHNK